MKQPKAFDLLCEENNKLWSDLNCERKAFEKLKQEKYKLMEQVVELQEKSIEKQKVIDVLDKYVIIDYHNKKQIKKELEI